MCVPVALFRLRLRRLLEAGVVDGILHALILIRDLIGRALGQCEELRRQAGRQLGLGQPQRLTHPCRQEVTGR